MVKSLFLLSMPFWVASCYCGGPETIQEYDLENHCGSLPCDVKLLNGSAAIVTTYHSGEHGIRLEKNSAMRIDASTPAPLEADAHLQVLFLCDANTSFDVVLGAEDTSGPTETNLMGMPSPPSTTGELSAATFVLPVPDSQVFVRPQLRFLQFTTMGPGGCTFDDIWVFTPNLCQG